MEFEFDKEIDAILRRARSGEVATSAGAHLDADEFAAFAENSVSDAARMRFVAHLADCTRCRKILSNVILLNSEAETETASSVVSTPVLETKTPWYRRLFVFPQLAYTMGGLVLLFSGFFGYLILKNLPGSQNSDVSFSTDNPVMEKRAAANSAPAAANSNSATTTTTSNSSAPLIPSASSNASSTANSAPLSASNTATAATPAQTEKSAERGLTEPVAVPQATTLPDAKKTQDKPITDGMVRDDLAKVSPASPTAGASQNRAMKREENQKKDTTTDSTRSGDEDKNAVMEQQAPRKSSPMTKNKEKLQSNAGETRSVGGKTFNNVGGIWFDSAYGKQKQKTVRRGTSDYLKLDSGLRSTADSLGGTVVILWGGKAYRIQ